MPDNWGYVVAAYIVTAAMLAGYWRHLVRRAAALAAPRPPRRRHPGEKMWPAPGSPPARP
jgi:hypothetical protein